MEVDTATYYTDLSPTSMVPGSAIFGDPTTEIDWDYDAPGSEFTSDSEETTVPCPTADPVVDTALADDGKGKCDADQAVDTALADDGGGKPDVRYGETPTVEVVTGRMKQRAEDRGEYGKFVGPLDKCDEQLEVKPLRKKPPRIGAKATPKGRTLMNRGDYFNTALADAATPTIGSMMPSSAASSSQHPIELVSVRPRRVKFVSVKRATRTPLRRKNISRTPLQRKRPSRTPLRREGQSRTPLLRRTDLSSELPLKLVQRRPVDLQPYRPQQIVLQECDRSATEVKMVVTKRPEATNKRPIPPPLVDRDVINPENHWTQSKICLGSRAYGCVEDNLDRLLVDAAKHSRQDVLFVACSGDKRCLMRDFLDKTTKQTRAATVSGKWFQYHKRVIPLFSSCKSGPKGQYYAVLHKAGLDDCRYGDYTFEAYRRSATDTALADPALAQFCFTEVLCTAIVMKQAHWYTKILFFYFPEDPVGPEHCKKVAHWMGDLIKIRGVKAIAGWVGKNSKVLAELANVVPLSGDWPLCQYVNTGRYVNGSPIWASKMQWLFVNAVLSQPVRYQKANWSLDTTLWDTALAATRQIWGVVEGYGKQCPACGHQFRSKGGLFRHVYPKSTCLTEMLGWTLFWKNDTALADGSDSEKITKLIKESFIPWNDMAWIKCAWNRGQIEKWQAEVYNITGKHIAFNVGKIHDCGFDGFTNYVPARKTAGALLAQPDQHGHLIIVGGGTPSPKSINVQKQQDKVAFRRRDGTIYTYGKKHDFVARRQHVEPYDVKKAQDNWRQKAQYKTPY